MNPFNFLKSSDKAMDALIKGGDALIYTQEEKAEAKAKLFETWLDLQKTVATQSTPTSISRRVVAAMVLLPFVYLIVASSLVKLATAFDFTPERIEKLNEISVHFMMLAEKNFYYLSVSVIIFYFGPHMIDKFKQR